MKRILCLILLAASMFIFPAAYSCAEISGKDIHYAVEAKVIERIDGENVNLNWNETYDLPFGAGTYKPVSYLALSCEETGIVDLYVYTEFDSDLAETGNTCLDLSDYDYAVMTKSSNSDSGYQIYWPEKVYLLRNDYSQEVLFPVHVDGSIELIFNFRIPADTTLAAFVYTNVWGSALDELASGGSFVYSNIHRTVMDFTFKNETDCGVTGLYFAPEEEKSWGNNLCGSSTVASDEIFPVSFYNTDYRDETGKKWECRIELENGRVISFADLDLDSYTGLTLHPAEEEKDRYQLETTK